jgi:hypothetical protein
MVGSLDM